MRYLEPVFRPPSEAGSYILQITYGCSHNKCKFCGMYKNKTFRLRPLEEIKEDILLASEIYPDTRKVFLADGDSLILKTNFLLEILTYLNNSFKYLQRVGIYANTEGILSKTPQELISLKDMKLGIAYLGLESGSESLLKAMNKGCTANEMTKCVIKAQSYGIKMSVIVLLGLGGVEHSKEHAVKTSQVLNKMQPRYLSALTLMPVKGTQLYEDYKKHSFILPGSEDILKELKIIIENLSLEGTIFRSDHASNYLPLKGRFPKDKDTLLQSIDYVLNNNRNSGNLLIPEFLRGL